MFKVTIGDPNKCSCNSRPGEHCIHIVYCLLKVLRIPCENHMSWQTGYTDTEIDIVLAGNFRGRVVRPVMKRAKPEAEPTAIVNPGGSNVPRQPLEGDECYCPICQDLMNITQALSWCRKGCGNNVHAKVTNALFQNAFSTADLFRDFIVVYENVCSIQARK